MKNRDVMIWKAVALGAVIIYLVKASKANGGSLSGNPYGIKLNPEKVADFASRFAPSEYRPHARSLGAAILKRYM